MRTPTRHRQPHCRAAGGPCRRGPSGGRGPRRAPGGAPRPRRRRPGPQPEDGEAAEVTAGTATHVDDGARRRYGGREAGPPGTKHRAQGRVGIPVKGVAASVAVVGGDGTHG
jgi:hypothetical protein